MSDPLRTAVVGLGWVGQARHIPALKGQKGVEIVGLVDRREGRAAEAANRHGVAAHARAERLADVPFIDDVDAVSIATAPMSHAALVCEALERGLHVITEKPFAMNRDEAEAMCGAAERSERTLAVVHNFQFARSMKRLQADLATEKLGRITGVRALQMGNPRRRLPVWYDDLPLGLFYDESPHLLYLLRSVVGPLALKKAVLLPSRTGKATPAQIDAWFDADLDVPVTLSCNFESAVSEWYLMVHGEAGMGIVDVFRDIYVALPNDRTHGTMDVVRTSVSSTAQHWWQHLASGIPHLTGRLLYGNDEVFARFTRQARGQSHGENSDLAPIGAEAGRATLFLQHDIIESHERLNP